MDKWVACLNCGHEYFIENYIKKCNMRCPECKSKEYEVLEEENNYRPFEKDIWGNDKEWKYR